MRRMRRAKRGLVTFSKLVSRLRRCLCNVAWCCSFTWWLLRYYGAWLSLVERCVRDAEVAGSNPVAPIFIKPCQGDVDWKVKLSHKCRGGVLGELGFEPRLKESESFVLPLHYSPAITVGQILYLTLEVNARVFMGFVAKLLVYQWFFWDLLMFMCM